MAANDHLNADAGGIVGKDKGDSVAVVGGKSGVRTKVREIVRIRLSTLLTTVLGKTQLRRKAAGAHKLEILKLQHEEKQTRAACGEVALEQRMCTESQVQTGVGEAVLKLTLEQLSAGTECPGGLERSRNSCWTGVWRK
eukprot:g39938.t1